MKLNKAAYVQAKMKRFFISGRRRKRNPKLFMLAQVLLSVQAKYKVKLVLRGHSEDSNFCCRF